MADRDRTPQNDADVIRHPGSATAIDANGMPHGCCESWPECSHVYYAVAARDHMLALLAEKDAEIERLKKNISDEAVQTILSKEHASELADQVRTLTEALRPFVEKWDLHAAPYLMEQVDGEEARVLTARTVDEMISDIRNARAALASVQQPPAEGGAVYINGPSASTETDVIASMQHPPAEKQT